MATTPPNQASGTGSTVKGKVKPKNRPAGTPTTPSARWNANKHHTVSYSDHLGNVKAKQQLGTTDLTAPPSAAQAITEANSAADAQFGPQVRAAQQAQANVQPWFADYMARVAGYATAAKTAMQPTLDEAGQLADPTTAAQTQQAPGLDPNSEAGRASAMAAQGRAALAKLGQQALQTTAQSAQDTFAGQGLLAQRELPQAQAYAASQLAGAQSDRGAAVTKFLTDARANAQNYQIARGTLGLNTEKAAADVASDTARQTETGRHNAASEADKAQSRKDAAAAKGQSVNKYGYTNEQWQRFSASHRQRIIHGFDADKGKSGDAKADAKHAADVQKATGSAKVKVQDIMDAWARGASVPAPTDQDKNATKPASREELRKALGAKYGGTWVAIMERVRAKQPLTTAQIDYLHSTDPNLRIPREWLPRKPNIASGTGNPASSQGTGLG